MKNVHEQIHICLKDFFGFKKFKGNQEKAIQSIISGKNTFVLMPTGGGKSLCYQLPAIILDGVAIIVSPLIALMKNQVDSIRSYAENENIAHFFNSSLSKSEKEKVKKLVLNGETKLLFVAPETVNKTENLEFLKKCNISFFAIDEAHCISEWGHDFRPEYRKIKTTIKEINNKTTPLIALTATATEKVKKDIIRNLGIEDSALFISSFNRPNLYYEIREPDNINNDLIKFIKVHSNKSGIVYCLARKSAEEISEILNLNNIKSLPYHAGLDKNIRIETQDKFLMEEINVVVATIAFGMGIDKPDVRYVIHYNLPKSLENYYQETGRCGRDGGEGECILYYKKEDVDKFKSFNSKKIGSEKEMNTHLLNEMVNYIQENTCRRKTLLHYFGENYNERNCNKQCDNCRQTKAMQDVKEKKETPSFDLKLLTVLQKVRQDIAKEKKIPPFIIFQDPSLEDMSIQYPITDQELKSIVGVGDGKVKKYGGAFITAIKHHVEENNIAKVNDYIIKSKPKKNDLKIFIIQSADRKLSFEDIMEQKKISMTNLIGEIESIVHSGTKINIDYHINSVLDEFQQDEIREYFLHEANNDSIDEAKIYFEEEYEEEEIRLMKIKLFSDLAN